VLLELFRLAEREGIAVEAWNFRPPVRAIYLPGNPPIIGLDKHLTRAELRTYLAEELGHHSTAAVYSLGRPYFCYRDRLNIGIMEQKAKVWAAKWLISETALLRALKWAQDVWEVAEELEVLPELVQVRLTMLVEASVQLSQCG